MSSISINIRGVTSTLGNVKRCTTPIGKAVSNINEVRRNIDSEVASRRSIRRRLTNIYIDLEELNNKLERIYNFGHNAMDQYQDTERAIKDLLAKCHFAEASNNHQSIIKTIVSKMVDAACIVATMVGPVAIVKSAFQCAAIFKDALQPGGALYKAFEVGEKAFRCTANIICQSIIASKPLLLLAKEDLKHYKECFNSFKTGAIVIGKKATAWLKEHVQMDKFLDKAWQFGKAVVSTTGKVIKNAVLSSTSFYINMKRQQIKQLKTGAKLLVKGTVAVFKKVVNSKPFKIVAGISGVVVGASLITVGWPLITGGSALAALGGGALVALGLNDVISNFWDIGCVVANKEQYSGEGDLIRKGLVYVGYKIDGERGARIAETIDTFKDVAVGVVQGGNAFKDYKAIKGNINMVKASMKRYKQVKDCAFLQKATVKIALREGGKGILKSVGIIDGVKKGEVYVFDSSAGKVVNALWRVMVQDVALCY